MIEYSHVSKIHEWTLESLKILGYLNSRDLRLNVELNNKYLNKLGTAKCEVRNNMFHGVTSYAAKLWDRIPEEERKNTVFHEVCHVVDKYLEWKGVRPVDRSEKNHGETWKALMLQCGADPHRYYKNKIDMTGLKDKYRFECGCKIHLIGKIRATRATTGVASYRCSLCGQTLKPLDENK